MYSGLWRLSGHRASMARTWFIQRSGTCLYGDLSVPGDELVCPKSHHWTGRDVEPQVGKTARPGVHYGQGPLVVVADRQPEDLLRGIKVEHRAGWNLADTGFAEIINSEARRDFDGGAVLQPVVLAHAAHDDVFLQHCVSAERVAPGTEDMNSGRPDQVEEHGPELPEVRTGGEAPSA